MLNAWYRNDGTTYSWVDFTRDPWSQRPSPGPSPTTCPEGRTRMAWFQCHENLWESNSLRHDQGVIQLHQLPPCRVDQFVGTCKKNIVSWRTSKNPAFQSIWSCFAQRKQGPLAVAAVDGSPPEVGIAGTATLYVAEQTGVAQGLMAFSRGEQGSRQTKP